MVRSFCLVILVCFCTTLFGQANTDSLQQKRLKPLIITSSIVYTGALVGLNELWYSDFERESFHFFNDHTEWKQMDKAGHFYAAFHISKGGYRVLQWAGQENDKAILWGTLLSAIVLTPIEIFDGFSSAYGASYSDLIANSAGGAFFYLQQKHWGDIKIHPKFSFRRSQYPAVRPELLGKSFQEELLKDYNAQTYWLSVDLSKIIHSNFPKWLNLAVGYGVTNMVAARDSQSTEMGYTPQRQYYLALDFDFNEYKTKSKFINTLLYLVNMIHLPAPTLELSDKLKFHPAY
ncbi:DUF2279 domain-containing protein [Fulvivirga sp. RKSG066]|nr:DUF2279 domain-containing protein [Fulvivirga aurantia]